MHGNLHSPDSINFYKSIGASPRVLDIIKSGYKIPFEKLPNPFWYKNNQSAVQNMNFVREKVSSWLEAGFVIKREVRPKFVSPLSVDCRKPKKRLCLDCTVINENLIKENTKLPTLKLSESLVEPNDHAKILDMQNAYFHVQISPEDWDKLSFAIPKEDDPDQYEFYSFRVLIYGISTATAVLNLLTKPLIDFALTLNIKVTIYIDDLRITCCFRFKLEEQTRTIKQIFNMAGFIFNLEKESDISQEYQYLGFVFNTRSFRYSVPVD